MTTSHAASPSYAPEGDEPGGLSPDRAERINVLDREFGTLIRRSQRGAARVSERIHPDLDSSAFPLLVHLEQNPGVRPSDLAHHFGIGRATTSRQLTRLVNLGLVEREVDPDDCRGQELSLTPEGEARLLETQKRRRAWYRRVLEEWSDSDLETFTELLARFARAVEEPPATDR